MKYWWSILLVVSTTTARSEEFRFHHGSYKKEQNSHRVGNILSIVDFGGKPMSRVCWTNVSMTLSLTHTYPVSAINQQPFRIQTVNTKEG